MERVKEAEEDLDKCFLSTVDKLKWLEQLESQFAYEMNGFDTHLSAYELNNSQIKLIFLCS